MRKQLLGLGMMLSGTVGFTGWCMAAVMKVEPGARSRIFGCLYGTDCSRCCSLLLWQLLDWRWLCGKPAGTADFPV